VAVALRHLGYELVPTEVVVNDFVEDVPAASVLELGDSIEEIDGTPISSVSDIRSVLEGLEVGDTLEMTISRDGEETTVTVELAEREDEPGAPMIGVMLGELTEPPFPVSIEAGDVGGPSAGMMHTLAIIDTLTEGELTGGNVIAGTGTISLDGSVGSIGGIRQKVVAAEAAGADYILVPEGNYESALTAERESIEIVPVATIDDAIDFLESLDPA
jgi:PDZ domain-containing protein